MKRHAIFLLFPLLLLWLGGCVDPVGKFDNPVDPKNTGEESGEDSAEAGIPRATITVDGRAEDWSEISPFATDEVGDNETADSAGDITELYLARDDEFLYWRMDTAGEGYDFSGDRVYRVYFNVEGYQDQPAAGLQIDPVDAGWMQYVERWPGEESYATVFPADYVASGETLEAKAELSFFVGIRATDAFGILFNSAIPTDEDGVHSDRSISLTYSGEGGFPAHSPAPPTGSLVAEGAIAGTPVELTGRISLAEPEGEAGMVTMLGRSVHPDSYGEEVSLEFGLRGVTEGSYRMPSLGDHGMWTAVGSTLLDRTEGFYSIAVGEPSRISIENVGNDFARGSFSLHYLGDTLTGSFDLPLSNWSYDTYPLVQAGTIDSRTITIDGDPSDWDDGDPTNGNGVGSVIIDPSDDGRYPDKPGSDISRISVAADGTYLYFMMELTDGSPSTTQEFEYETSVHDAPGDNGGLDDVLRISYDGSSWGLQLKHFDGTSWSSTPLDPSWCAVGSVIEMKMERAGLPPEFLVSGRVQRVTVAEDPDVISDWLFQLP